VDLLRHSREEYHRRVIGFLDRHLTGPTRRAAAD
jgi:hypothetical protein